MAASKLQIVNNALLMLGDDRITTVSAISLTSTTKAARLMANLWETAPQFVLRSHPWNFAVKRAVLSGSLSEAFGEWTYRIVLPSDCLRVLSVGEEGDDDEYRIEGRYLLTDDQAPKLRYIYDHTTVSEWDAVFVSALELYLAWKAAYPLTASNTLAGEMRDAFLAHIKIARTVDGQEQPFEITQDIPLVDVRFQGVRGGRGA